MHVLVTLSLLLSGWVYSLTAVADTEPAPIRLFAAASLMDVVDAHVAAYHVRYPTQRILVSYAGSSTLAKQLQHGARADLFFSADTDWVNHLLSHQRLIPESVKTLALNQLVLISPLTRDIPLDWEKDTPPAIKGRLCMADPSHVPAGRYTKAALMHWGWWDSLSQRAVLSEDVRASLQRVAQSACAMGVVYETDARASSRVRVLGRFDASSHPAIRYQGGLTLNASEAARAFWAFFGTEESIALFTRFGFLPPDEMN